MKKSLIEKKIKEIAKYLTGEKASAALGVLREELEDYEEAVITNSERNMEVGKEVKSKSHAYALYTDGACRGNPGPGSYAYIVQTSDNEIYKRGAKAFEYTTNNKMELSAIIEGIKDLEGELSPLHEVYIYTDSKYAVDGIKSWVAGWKKRGWKKADKKAPENLELWQELDKLNQEHKLFFHWVKGHAGHVQNEYVDNMANQVLDENGY